MQFFKSVNKLHVYVILKEDEGKLIERAMDAWTQVNDFD